MRQVSDMTVSVETVSSTLYSCGTVFPTNWPNCRDASAGLRAVCGEMEVLSPTLSQPRGGSRKQAGSPPAATKRSPRVWLNDGRRYPEIPTYCSGLDGSGDGGGAGAGPPHYRTLGVGLRQHDESQQTRRDGDMGASLIDTPPQPESSEEQQAAPDSAPSLSSPRWNWLRQDSHRTQGDQRSSIHSPELDQTHKRRCVLKSRETPATIPNTRNASIPPWLWKGVVQTTVDATPAIPTYCSAVRKEVISATSSHSRSGTDDQNKERHP